MQSSEGSTHNKQNKYSEKQRGKLTSSCPRCLDKGREVTEGRLLVVPNTRTVRSALLQHCAQEVPKERADCSRFFSCNSCWSFSIPRCSSLSSRPTTVACDLIVCS
mmetsp:Transcript_4360/g.6144  ORF Transcript_4360/g.6144 Transcript_4360/m.6144 type:complete len:106 (+) Transcript_4360:1-318(+)